MGEKTESTTDQVWETLQVLLDAIKNHPNRNQLKYKLRDYICLSELDFHVLGEAFETVTYMEGQFRLTDHPATVVARLEASPTTSEAWNVYGRNWMKEETLIADRVPYNTALLTGAKYCQNLGLLVINL